MISLSPLVSQLIPLALVVAVVVATVFLIRRSPGGTR